MTIKAILVVLGLLPVWKEDHPGTPEKTRQLESVAAAVQSVARTPDEAAFLLAWGDAESKYSLRIHAGFCKPLECDRGRARGPWQVHRRTVTSATQWDKMHGLENVQAQADEAAKMARWALRQCPNDRIRGAFRVLGGNGCSRPLKGEAERVATYERVRSKL